jgi:hypothetical protein
MDTSSFVLLSVEMFLVEFSLNWSQGESLTFSFGASGFVTKHIPLAYCDRQRDHE